MPDRLRRSWCWAACLLGLGTSAVWAGGLPPHGAARAGEVLVRFREQPASTELTAEAARLHTVAELQPLRRALTASEGLTLLGELSPLQVQRLRVAATANTATVLANLRRSPLVSYCEPNHLLTALGTLPNDPYYRNGFLGGTEWWVSAIEADRVVAEGLLPHGARVVIAILDTGILLTHEDLQARLEPGVDLITPGGNANDDDVDEFGQPRGHGTHAAGIAAAITNNGVGVAGTASADTSSIRLLPVKVLDANGNGDDYTVVQGLLQAVARGARVANLSIGGTDDSQILHDAVDYARAQGCVVVAAAGNFALGEGNGTSIVNPVIYPAAYASVVAVAACTASGDHAPYSEYGTYVALAAPGGTLDSNATEILSTMRDAGQGPYGYLAGTSMAAPAVAGAAAMLLCQDPTRTPEAVVNLLTATAVKTGSDPYTDGWNPTLGWGRLDLYRALTRATTFQAKAAGRPSYNYPNPFAPAKGQVTYVVVPAAAGPGAAQLRIFDALGRSVRTLTVPADQVWAGSTVAWDGRNDHGEAVANGVYPYRLELDGAVYANKIVVKN